MRPKQDPPPAKPITDSHDPASVPPMNSKPEADPAPITAQPAAEHAPSSPKPAADPAKTPITLPPSADFDTPVTPDKAPVTAATGSKTSPHHDKPSGKHYGAFRFGPYNPRKPSHKPEASFSADNPESQSPATSAKKRPATTRGRSPSKQQPITHDVDVQEEAYPVKLVPLQPTLPPPAIPIPPAPREVDFFAEGVRSEKKGKGKGKGKGKCPEKLTVVTPLQRKENELKKDKSLTPISSSE